MIRVTVNGREVHLEGPTPLPAYLSRLGVDRRAVAVEVNGRILDRADYDAATLEDGDLVEIVRMVGGGTGPKTPSCASWVGSANLVTPAPPLR